MEIDTFKPEPKVIPEGWVRVLSEWGPVVYDTHSRRIPIAWGHSLLRYVGPDGWHELKSMYDMHCIKKGEWVAVTDWLSIEQAESVYGPSSHEYIVESWGSRWDSLVFWDSKVILKHNYFAPSDSPYVKPTATRKVYRGPSPDQRQKLLLDAHVAGQGFVSGSEFSDAIKEEYGVVLSEGVIKSDLGAFAKKYCPQICQSVERHLDDFIRDMGHNWYNSRWAKNPWEVSSEKLWYFRKFIMEEVKVYPRDGLIREAVIKVWEDRTRKTAKGRG